MAGYLSSPSLRREVFGHVFTGQKLAERPSFHRWNVGGRSDNHRSHLLFSPGRRAKLRHTSRDVDGEADLRTWTVWDTPAFDIGCGVMPTG